MSAQPPSSPAVQGTGPRAPTAQEGAFLMAIMKHSDGVTNIDWDAVAAEAGYNKGDTARTRFGQVKRSLGWKSRSEKGGSAAAKSATPTKVTKAKANGTPRARKPKAKKKEEQVKSEAAVSEDMDAEDATNGHEENEEILKVEEDEDNGFASADEEHV